MEKKKQIAIVAGGRSSLSGSFYLSRALINSGNNVKYLCFGGGDFIQSQGFDCYDFAVNFDNETIENSESKTSSFFKRISSKLKKSDTTVFKLLKLIEKYLDEKQPDLALIDCNLTTFSLPFIKKKIPIITLNSTMSSFYFEGRLPVFSKHAPSNTFNLLLYLHKKSFWLRIISFQFFNELFRTFRTIMRLNIPVERVLWVNIRKHGRKVKRSEYGLRLLAPEIVLSPSGIEYPYPASRVNRLYAGFCVDENRVDEDFDFNCMDQNKKLIYCSLGTCSHNYVYAKQFYKSLIEVTHQLNEYQFVIQEGNSKNLEGDWSIPSNVLIFNRVPQLELIKRAIIFITHGGPSSFREGVFYTTPMIAFPGWHDQIGDSARIVYYGLGLVGDMKKLSPQLLLSMIRHIENNIQIKNSLVEMREKIAAQNEVHTCVGFVESFVG